MIHAVLRRAATALFGIAPKMFSDELCLGAGDERCCRPGDPGLEAIRKSAVHPRICNTSARILVQGDLVCHRNGAVGFVVNEAGDRRNRTAGNELLDEDHGTAERPVGLSTTDVESEVDLFEGAVTRNPDSPDSGVDEAEADKADEVDVTPEVELGAPRYERLEDLPGAFEVEENQTLPSSGQEGFCHSSKRLLDRTRRRIRPVAAIRQPTQDCLPARRQSIPHLETLREAEAL